MSDFHDDITQSPMPPDQQSSSERSDPTDTGGLIDPDAARRRLRAEDGVTAANEGSPPADDSPPDEDAPPPGFGPPATKRPERVTKVNDPDEPEDEPAPPADPPTVFDDVIDDIERTVDNLGRIVEESVDAIGNGFELSVAVHRGTHSGVMAELDEDGRPIEDDGDDFGFGGVH